MLLLLGRHFGQHSFCIVMFIVGPACISDNRTGALSCTQGNSEHCEMPAGCSSAHAQLRSRLRAIALLCTQQRTADVELAVASCSVAPQASIPCPVETSQQEAGSPSSREAQAHPERMCKHKQPLQRALPSRSGGASPLSLHNMLSRQRCLGIRMREASALIEWGAFVVLQQCTLCKGGCITADRQRGNLDSDSWAGNRMQHCVYLMMLGYDIVRLEGVVHPNVKPDSWQPNSDS